MEQLEIFKIKAYNLDDSVPTFEKPEIQELSEMSEATINFEWENCKKIQGHGGFIPWAQFLCNAKTYLSQAKMIYSEKLLSYLKTVGNLTVRIVIQSVSQSRPALYKKLFTHRGKPHIYTGSGCVVNCARISKYPCRCILCNKTIKNQADNRKKTFSFYIATATHAVYDDEEATSLTVELHYDDTERKTVRKLYGVSVCERSVNGDFCVVECVTCDEELANEMKTQLDSYVELYREFPRSDKEIAAIISHPHGQPKHISFGECTQKYYKRNGLFMLTSYEYNTATCPGSSGAPVLLMNDSCSFRGSQIMLPNLANHSGINEEGSSCSSVSADPTSAKQNVAKTEVITKNESHVEGQNKETFKAEANLHKHYKYCDKHPGHAQYIPVMEFTLDHLPDGYRDTDLVEIVRCLADLTGRLHVKQLSTKRPKVHPETKQRYTLYDIEAESRSGTGCIYFVRKVRDEPGMFCSCKKCQQSQNPSRVFYSVYVKTTLHLVFDNYEACHTSFRVFYDNQGSPLAIMDDWRVIDYNIKGDTCYLGSYTCDDHLGEILLNLTRRIIQLVEKISMKDLATSGGTDDIAIIVSHPHGLSKHVSVGTMTHKVDVKQTYDLTYSLLSYTTATCEGASGAPVFSVGKYLPTIMNKFVIQHVHSDALNNGNNKCSFAISNFNQ